MGRSGLVPPPISSLRRSLAALLELRSVPDHQQGPQMVAAVRGTHFGLTAGGEALLTRWMEARIDLLYAPSDRKPLRLLQVAKELEPILDQEDSPMWEPNPWRSYVTVSQTGDA